MNSAAIVALLMTSSLITTVIAEDYCAICSDHTMCKYSGVGPGCSTRTNSGVKTGEQRTILDEHNKLRNKVASGEEKGQPPASDMLQMEWNIELATIAQRWADQCNYSHDGCRDVSAHYVGQNIAMQGSSEDKSESEWPRAIKSWYSEVADFKGDVGNYKSGSGGGKPVGHYTQIVWASTYQIGCGYSYYKSGMHIKFYVCNYGPGGNILETVMYTEGESCSNCPSEETPCSAEYSGLCGTVQLEALNVLQLLIIYFFTHVLLVNEFFWIY